MDAFRRVRLAVVVLVAAAIFAAGTSQLAIAGGASALKAELAALADARKRVAAGDLGGAIAQLSRFVTDEPQADEAKLFLGDLEYRYGDVTSAELAYRAILEYAPDDRLTHDHLGRLYASRGRIRDAIDEFSRTLPSSSGYRHLVELHRLRGDLDGFVARYVHAAEVHPADATAQFAMGTIERASRHAADAVPYLERAVHLTPTCEMFAELGNTQYDLGRYPAAIDAFERCLALQPDDYSATLDLGNTYLTLGDAAGARRLFERDIASDPDRSEAFVDLGYLDDLTGDWQSAVPLYERAIAADPLIPEAYVDLGYDYDSHALFARAESAYHSGLAVAPDSGRLHYLLGDTYRHEGKRALALAEYRRAAHCDEDDIARAAAHAITVLERDATSA